MWREVWTDDQQDVYYFNEDTEVSQWEPPADWFRALNGMSQKKQRRKHFC